MAREVPEYVKEQDFEIDSLRTMESIGDALENHELCERIQDDSKSAFRYEEEYQKAVISEAVRLFKEENENKYSPDMDYNADVDFARDLTSSGWARDRICKSIGAHSQSQYANELKYQLYILAEAGGLEIMSDGREAAGRQRRKVDEKEDIFRSDVHRVEDFLHTDIENHMIRRQMREYCSSELRYDENYQTAVMEEAVQLFKLNPTTEAERYPRDLAFEQDIVFVRDLSVTQHYETRRKWHHLTRGEICKQIARQSQSPFANDTHYQLTVVFEALGLETNLELRDPETAQSLRPSLRNDVIHILRDLRRNNQGANYSKVADREFERVSEIALKLNHPEPAGYAHSIVNDASYYSGFALPDITQQLSRAANVAALATEPEGAQRLRAVLITDVAEILRAVRGKSQQKYDKVVEEQRNRLSYIAEELKHQDPFGYAETIIDDAIKQSGFHAADVAGFIERTLLDAKLDRRLKENVTYAKDALANGQNHKQVFDALVQRNYPGDTVQARLYAKDVLEEVYSLRMASGNVNPGHAVEEKNNNSGGIGQITNNGHNPSTLNIEQTERSNTMATAPVTNSNEVHQYKRDWSYAIRHLEKGESRDQVEKQIATFRHDLRDAVGYAQRTVEKAQAVLEYRTAMRESLSMDNVPLEDGYKSLDANLERLSTEEYARRLYANGYDTLVLDALQENRGLVIDEAIEVANAARSQFHAERDLDYATRHLARSEKPEEIAANIGKFRDGQVKDAKTYAAAVVQKAAEVREVEADVPTKALVDARKLVTSQEYARDLKFAFKQLEAGSDRDQVRLDIQERRPNKALQSYSYQIYGKPDHSYTVAVVQQAEGLRQMATQGFNLDEAMKVARDEFMNDLTSGIVDRQHFNLRSNAIKLITEGAPSKEFYARAVLNEAECIVNEQREASIRPEMARDLTKHFKPERLIPKEQPRTHEAGFAEAQELTKQLLGNEAKCSAPERNSGLYQGEIIGQTSTHYVQKLSPKSAIAHPKDAVSESLLNGQTCQIRYSNQKGQATIKENREVTRVKTQGR